MPGRGGAAGVAGGEACLLVLERLERALARRVGGCNQLGHVGTCQLAVAIECILKDGDDGLLERDDLGLQLVLGYSWTVIS